MRVKHIFCFAWKIIQHFNKWTQVGTRTCSKRVNMLVKFLPFTQDIKNTPRVKIMVNCSTNLALALPSILAVSGPKRSPWNKCFNDGQTYRIVWTTHTRGLLSSYLTGACFSKCRSLLRPRETKNVRVAGKTFWRHGWRVKNKKGKKELLRWKMTDGKYFLFRNIVTTKPAQGAL